MQGDNLHEIEAKLAEIVRREKQAQQRAIVLSGIPILVGLVWIAISYVVVANLERKREALQREVDAATKEMYGDVPKKDLGPSDIRQQTLARVPPGDRRRALELAFQLYDQQLPFMWGGKKPAQGGLDTSGYVAYVLNQVGVLNHPETYYSGLLRATFDREIESSKLKPGDLIFEENNACWFALVDNYAIGMVPQGIVIANTNAFSSPTIGRRLVVYNDEKTGR
jgi:hypothetical protein